MNITKNKIIEALNFLGRFPSKSLKKDELMSILNSAYGEEINELVIVINTKMYNLLKILVQADENGIDVDMKYEFEVDFLENILVIDEPTILDEKIHIKFNKNMKDKFEKFVNKENENKIRKNQKIVDLMINIVDVYGLIEDYEMIKMINRLLDYKIDIDYMYILLYNQIDLRNEVIIGDYEDCDEYSYLISEFVKEPADIIEERELRDLYYKKYTVKELEEHKFENLINTKEAKNIINFLENKGYEYSKEMTFNMILYIINAPQFDIKEFIKLINIDLEDEEEVKSYLQLVMSLYNSMPNCSLYGYSPNELFRKNMDEIKTQKSEKKKIGRNDPCICGSGKKYKHCCLNKVIKVDFRNEKHNDCIEEEYAKRFFALKNLLFYYINEKYHINDELEDFGDICDSEPEEVMEIREKLWSDKNIINDYIKENQNNLNEEFIKTIKDWNEKKIKKSFIIYKYEDEYTIFLDEEYIYYVKSLKEPIRKLVPETDLPVVVETVLLPLDNKIVYDSYINRYGISFGSNIKNVYKEKYNEMLKNGKVKYEL